jgi:acetylornithine deacetylase
MLARWHDELARRAHPLVGPPTWSVGLVEGGSGTSIVPALCRVVADRRLLPGENGADVVEEVRQRLTGAGLGDDRLDVEIALLMDMPGFETPGDHPFVVVADAALATAGGPGLPLGGWTAACDGGFLARDAGVPVVVMGPGSVTEQAHRADESVGVDELLVAARAYALTALRLLGGDFS